MTLDIRPEARMDVLEAAIWYETERDGLGFRFERYVNAAIERAVENPQLFPVVHEDVRRALVQEFPYAVLFVADSEGIVVLGVLHLHRDPDAWKGRL